MLTLGVWVLVVIGLCTVVLLMRISDDLKNIRARISHFEKKVENEGVMSGQIGFLIARLTGSNWLTTTHPQPVSSQAPADFSP